MKQYNINAVRTCHYPNDAAGTTCATSYGLYLIDEANIESHGMGYGAGVPGEATRAGKAPPRPHAADGRAGQEPSVDHLSGRSATRPGTASNFEATYDWIKRRDPSRPVQYERAELGGTRTSTAPCTPDRSPARIRRKPQSPAPDPLRIRPRHGEQRRELPGLLGPPSRATAQLQGGFIWDWVDQGLLADIPADRRVRSPRTYRASPAHPASTLPLVVISATSPTTGISASTAWCKPTGDRIRTCGK